MNYVLTAGITAALLIAGWYFFGGSGRASDAELVRLFEDLKADCLDGFGEHAKLACRRGLSVGLEIKKRGLAHRSARCARYCAAVPGALRNYGHLVSRPNRFRSFGV